MYTYIYVALAHPACNLFICPTALRFGLVTSCFILKETPVSGGSPEEWLVSKNCFEEFQIF